MPDMFLIPLQVFGLGFIISMFIAGLVKLMLDVIKRFTRGSEDKTE